MDIVGNDGAANIVHTSQNFFQLHWIRIGVGVWAMASVTKPEHVISSYLAVFIGRTGFRKTHTDPVLRIITPLPHRADTPDDL